MKFAHIRVSEYFTFAKQIFHSEAISLARRANFVEKMTGQNLSFFLVAGEGLEPIRAALPLAHAKHSRLAHCRVRYSLFLLFQALPSSTTGGGST